VWRCGSDEEEPDPVPPWLDPLRTRGRKLTNDQISNEAHEDRENMRGGGGKKDKATLSDVGPSANGGNNQDLQLGASGK
jgi:hypothetical protein